MTRQDYIDGKVSFADYYRSINKTAGYSITDKHLLARVHQAIINHDDHLNTIPLGLWDGLAYQAQRLFVPAFKKHDDYFTLGGGVCAVKQAARDAVLLEEVKS